MDLTYRVTQQRQQLRASRTTVSTWTLPLAPEEFSLFPLSERTLCILQEPLSSSPGIHNSQFLLQNNDCATLNFQGTFLQAVLRPSRRSPNCHFLAPSPFYKSTGKLPGNMGWPGRCKSLQVLRYSLWVYHDIMVDQPFNYVFNLPYSSCYCILPIWSFTED